MGQAAVARGSRAGINEYRFEVRLVEAGGVWSGQAIRTFRADPHRVTRRFTPRGFRQYRDEMASNGFELVRVRRSSADGRVA
jgi:hypothetical protein